MIDGYDKHPEQLPSPHVFATNAISMTRSLATLPRELFEATNIKTIVVRPLTAESSISDEVPSAGEYIHLPATNSTVTLDAYAMGDESVIYHEIVGHGVHFATCDPSFQIRLVGQQIDRGLAVHNPSDFAYKLDYITPYTEYDHTAFASDYGETNSYEDAATIAEALMTRQLPLTPELADTPLGKKAGVTLDRIDTLVPGFSDYWLTASPYF